MKVHAWDYEFGSQFKFPAAPAVRRKRKSVAQILRAAYRKHVRDVHTRQAVKRWLR